MASKLEKTVGLYEKVLATRPGVERKGMKTPYTLMNGHMFSFVAKEGGLALRLPSGKREAFLEKYKTKLVVQYDTLMKEYVQVPASLLARTAELFQQFEVSAKSIASLKPKPTTRSKKTASSKRVSKAAGTRSVRKEKT